jgi:hypothetical protein
MHTPRFEDNLYQVHSKSLKRQRPKQEIQKWLWSAISEGGEPQLW